MAVTYLRLFDPTQQFQLKNGAINVAGLLKVKLEGTDDWAPVFDEDGTQLQQPVILDNNGRSKGLFVDASKVYWLEVDDRDGYELFTIRKMVPCGGGTGSSLGATYDVQSTDGTVDVTRYDNGGTVTFDLSIATVNEAAKWGATFGTASSISAGDIWEQVPAWTSAGSVAWNNGWEATKDCVADIAASLEMTSGDADAISTFDVRCDFSVDGTVVSTEYGMLDPSDNTGRVTFEYKGALTEGQKIDCRFSVKSVEAMNVALAARAYYNEECDGVVGGDDQGTTYIPGDYVEITTADVINVTGLQPVSGMTSYVQQSSFSSISSVVSSIQNDTGYISSVVSGITGEFTGYVPYSSLSGDGSKITGIDGSAIGGTDYSAGEYIDISGVTISVTGLQPVSGMSSYVEKSAFDDCCSAMSGAVSSLQVDVSSISSVVSGLTGQTGDYVEKSAISAQSSIWNEASGMSGKLDNSASSLWYPMTGNPSGFLTAHQDLSGYVPVSAISAESSIWNSASAISAVIPWSALEGTGTTITAISGSSIGGSTSTGGKTYSGIDPIVVDNTADTISVKHSGLTVDETMTAYTSGTDIVIGVNTGTLASSMIPWDALSGDGTSITGISGSAIGGGGVTGDYVEKSSLKVAIGDSNVVSGQDTFAQGTKNSARYDAFAQGSANSATSESFAQGGKNEAYADSFAQGHTNFASGYSFAQGDDNFASGYSFAQGRKLIAADYAVVFGRYNLKGYGSTSTGNSAAFAIGDGTSNYDRHDLMLVTKDGEITMYSSTADTTGTGIMSSIRTISAVASGKQDASAMTAYQLSGDYAYNSALSAYQPSGDYAYNSSLSGYIPTSESSKYVTSLSGYATEAYVDSAVSGKQDASAMTAYQLSGDYAYNSALTAYQPSGDYAYNSSVSGKADSSSLTAYQEITGMTAYQPSGDYAYNSALTAYQPSGDYIYASALGTGVI